MQFTYAIHLYNTITPSTNNPEDVLKRLELRVPKDWAWDFKTEDLAKPFRLVTGADAVVQSIFFRLRFFLGEWFLDQREGVPWFERILVNNPDIRTVEAVLKTAIESAPLVAQVKNLVTFFDKATRQFSLTGWTAVLDDGTEIEWPRGKVEPFIISP